jgi:methylenetetrahydrofolate dehydrogenase (NADP+)/methenyltetrahydrofolate cyclohydrolase
MTAAMTATVLDGKAVAARVRGEIAEAAAKLRAAGVEPGLAVVLVGDDPASHIYVRNKTTACAQAGIRTFDHRLPATTPETELLALVAALNADPAVDGILIQLPLPTGIDARRVLFAVDPRKDVDGIHPENVGRLLMGAPRFVACTPFGVMKLIEEAKLSLAGANAVVVGRSNMVGKPMAALLLNANATVTVCHSQTRDLPGVVGRADLVVAAVGRAEMIRGDWIKPGAVVIDVGINRGADNKLRGDVEYAAAAARASHITPVPGGVGPMTIAMLLANTVTAARLRAGG